VQVGRRLREARNDRARGGLDECARRALVNLRPQLDERGPAGQSRPSCSIYVAVSYL
jgi:hypothetical protein